MNYKSETMYTQTVTDVSCQIFIWKFKFKLYVIEYGIHSISKSLINITTEEIYGLLGHLYINSLYCGLISFDIYVNDLTREEKQKSMSYLNMFVVSSKS